MASGGKPWSGKNPIPTISQFVEGLDKDKKSRDREIDEQYKAQSHEGVKAHKNEPQQEGGKRVHDPVTGKDVTISDVDKKYMANVDNPMVNAPNVDHGCSS